MLYESGAGSIDVYLALARKRAVDQEALKRHVERPWRNEYSSMWCGLGGRVLLGYRAFGTVTPSAWQDLERAVRHSWFSDQYLGCAGIAPVVAEIGRSDPGRARAVALRIVARTARQLQHLLKRHANGASVFVGLSHGVAGLLLAFEQACALTGQEGGSIRRPVIEFLRSVALQRDDMPLWPMRSRSASPSELHGFCHGTPGVAFAAIFGYRYSLDTEYEQLINESLQSIALRGGPPGFCCGTLARVEVMIEAHRLTGDTGVLQTAKTIFADVSQAKYQSERWADGAGGVRFSQARLDAPLDIDLPGFPLQLEALPT